jgi:hypothetical protein
MHNTNIHKQPQTNKKDQMITTLLQKQINQISQYYALRKGTAKHKTTKACDNQ